MEKIIKSNLLTVVADTNGAELHSIKTPDGTEYLWQSGDAWKRFAPVLFPFICNTSTKKYKANGVEYTMPNNHGFARDMEFELVKHDVNSVIFKLLPTDETRKCYPYEFELKVLYLVMQNKIVVANVVKNNDTKDMYYYIGGHPAFNCPIGKAGSFSDWYCEFDHAETIVQKTDKIERTVLQDAFRLGLSRELFDYDVIMQEHPKSKTIALRSDKSKRYVKLDFSNNECIAVWSPTARNDAEFVCLEPWLTVPTYCDDAFDDIEKKPHATKLAPGEERCFAYTIEIGR